MLSEKKNKLAYNFFFLRIVQAIMALFHLLVIRYTIRITGVDGFGVVAVAKIVILCLSVFTDFGFNQTGTRNVSLYRSDRAEISRIFFTINQSLVLFSQVAYPGICQLVPYEKKHLISFWKQIYIPFLFFVLSGCLVLFIFSTQVCNYFMGNEYYYSIFFLRMVCIVLVTVSLKIPATLMLLAMNHKTSYFRIVTLGMVLIILSNLLLVHFFQATGTIISIFITDTFIMRGLSLEVYRYFKIHKNVFKPG